MSSQKEQTEAFRRVLLAHRELATLLAELRATLAGPAALRALGESIKSAELSWLWLRDCAAWAHVELAKEYSAGDIKS